MNQAIEHEYRRLRASSPHYTASNALHDARTIVRWEEMGGTVDHVVDLRHADRKVGTVRLLIVVDHEQYDDSFLECQSLTSRQVEHERKQLWGRIRRDGVYGIVSQWFDGDAWRDADLACWGFIGDDWRADETEYMQSAIDAYDEHADKLDTERAAELASRATYATVVAYSRHTGDR